MALQNRLKEQRERSRLTQIEVAKLLDIDMTTVSRHESAKDWGRGLTRDMIEKYAKLYKVMSHELFLEIDDADTE